MTIRASIAFTTVAMFALAASALTYAQDEERTSMPSVCAERDVNCVLNTAPASGSASGTSTGQDELGGVGSTRSDTPQIPNTKVLVPPSGSDRAVIVIPPPSNTPLGR